jgi:hypothetical protein
MVSEPPFDLDRRGEYSSQTSMLDAALLRRRSHFS